MITLLLSIVFAIAFGTLVFKLTFKLLGLGLRLMLFGITASIFIVPAVLMLIGA